MRQWWHGTRVDLVESGDFVSSSGSLELCTRYTGVAEKETRVKDLAEVIVVEYVKVPCRLMLL